MNFAHGHFHAVVSGIMARRLVPVAIHSKDRIRRQLGHHRPPAWTVERGKIIGLAGTVIQSRAVFLEKGVATGGGLQHAQEAALKIIVIGKIRARPGVGTPAARPDKGWKKAVFTVGLKGSLQG